MMLNESADSKSITHSIESIGRTLAKARLSRNLTQLQLAKATGTSRATINRLESGQSTSLETFVRVLLALDLLDALNAALPDTEVSPIARIKLQGQERRRASGQPVDSKASDWAWGDEDEQ